MKVQELSRLFRKGVKNINIFNVFKRKEETRDIEVDNALLQALVGKDVVTKEMALNIPVIAGVTELISNTVASLPIKLYKEQEEKVEEVLGDKRTKLLNDETGDTLDSFQFKKALVEDYLLKGNGYAYIHKEKNKLKSLHYVEEINVSINKNVDPIFKDYSILVNASQYKPYEFLKLLRKTKDGAVGKGLVQENSDLIAVMYNNLKYENVLAKTGGNKKGFIKSTSSKLTDEAIRLLKEQWRKMYSNNTENCIVLNNGLEFQESSATPTEMQMNQNKVTNAEEICKILNIPPTILGGDGKANESDYDKFFKLSILPIIQAFTTALNRDLLLEKEKGAYYFAFDIKELLKGDIKKRYEAYEIAIKNKILGVNEVRYEEDKEPIEAFNDVVVLGLNDVLYNTKTGTIYTPNTDKQSNMTEDKSEKIDLKGGEIENESGNKE